MAKELHRAPESLAVWESNMKELRRLQPKLASALEEYAHGHGHAFEHTENTTPAGRWIDGLARAPFFQPDGDPKFEWSRKTKDSSVFFLYGVGVPPYLFKAMRALPADALSLVVVEPSLALLAYTLHLTHVYRAMPSAGRPVFLTLPEITPAMADLPEAERNLLCNRAAEELRQEALGVGVSAFGVFTISLSKISAHEGETSVFESEFADMAAQIREWAVLRLNALGNSAEDTMLGLRQMALMSPWIVYGSRATAMVGHFKDRPFIVVSAGPSLEKNFDLLREVRDKAVIVATDAVLGKMLKSGIPPHIVCALERGFPTYDLLFAENVELYPEECSRILMITQAVCTPKIYGRWPGPKAIVGKAELPLDQWFLGAVVGGNMIPSGASVAHMNYMLGSVLGASSVALIGQDLALGEGGKTHAGDIFGEGELNKLQKSVEQGPVYRVPGALGGYVETTEVWLMFLRAFESFIRTRNTPTWDCTEGGALIAGTKVEPFAKFIEEKVAPLEPFEKTPAQVVREAGTSADPKEALARIKGNITQALDGLGQAENIMREIEDCVAKASAAGLEPQRRVAFGQKTGRLLDELHGKNPMFAFVTQSYVYLASVELTKTRALESVEMVERWVAFHEEILSAHRSVLAFIRGWLSYADGVLEYYAENELPILPPTPEEAERRFLALFEDETEEAARAQRFRLDALLSVCDPVRLGWDGRKLRILASALLEEGRSEEAAVFMAKAAEDFDGKEMPVDEMTAFFKDYARVLSTNDLCFQPPYHMAEVMLSNAIRLGGTDDETRALMEAILDCELASYENAMVFYGAHGRGVTSWFKARAAGERALLGGELPKALRLVWKAIKDNASDVPGWAASHLHWLAKTLEKCFDASPGPLADAVDDILRDMANSAEILQRLPIGHSPAFMAALIEHGLNAELAVPIRAEDATEEVVAE